MRSPTRSAKNELPTATLAALSAEKMSPKTCAATSRSKITGHRTVRGLRAPHRSTARRAAVVATVSTDSSPP